MTTLKNSRNVPNFKKRPPRLFLITSNWLNDIGTFQYEPRCTPIMTSPESTGKASFFDGSGHLLTCLTWSIIHLPRGRSPGQAMDRQGTTNTLTTKVSLPPQRNIAYWPVHTSVFDKVCQTEMKWKVLTCKEISHILVIETIFLMFSFVV